MIENRRLSFILCGSNARKLREGQANLLGSRAWRFEMFPLVSAEVSGLDLLRALTHGLIPSHYDSTRPDRSLQAFTDDYLKEEIAAEALNRNLSAFAGNAPPQVGKENGEIVNYAAIASDVSVDSKTMRSFEDTMIGRFLPPPAKPGSRKHLVATPKFHLFDPGVARILRRVNISALEGREAGRLFGTFIAHELRASTAYRKSSRVIHYYRTKARAEVDFILNHRETAIKVTISRNVREADLKGLKFFKEPIWVKV